MTSLRPIGQIEGLGFLENAPLGASRWACGSGHPFYIVYHGREDFEYPHFGVHLGQEDRLTFLGDSNRRFLGSFLDCRAGSRTHGARVELELRPDPSQCLVIPPGVGHSFSGLEDIYTINSYRLFLPAFDRLKSDEVDWNIENDVINVPLDAGDAPRYQANEEEASDLLYEIMASNHRVRLVNADVQYPIIQDFQVRDGHTVRLKLTARTAPLPSMQSSTVPPTVADRVRWVRHLTVRSGDTSGIIVVPEFGPVAALAGPFQSVRNVCGAHLDKPLAITFVAVGSDTAPVELKLAEGNETFVLQASPFEELRLSPGVDCAVQGRGVFAVIRSDEPKELEILHAKHAPAGVV